MPTVKGSKSRKRVTCQQDRVTVCSEDRRGELLSAGSSYSITDLVREDQLYSRVTISALPDDVLLEIFKFYVDQDCHEDAWHTLIHVCQKWRYVVFASPRGLHLRLHCTSKNPAKEMLDVWPTLPLAIDGFFTGPDLPGVTNITAALEEHDRVCRINIWGVPYSLLENSAVMKKPFPELTDMSLRSYDAPLIPASFLGGSTPLLQSLELGGIQLPSLGKLLPSATGLVTLRLLDIPNPKDNLPDVMATYLSKLVNLQELFIDFRFPRSEDDRENRSLPPLARRLVLPSLTEFYFKGDSEYLEDLVDRIDTPVFDKFSITFFDQESFDTPLLRDFFSRTKAFQALHRAAIVISSSCVNVTLFRRNGMVDHNTLDVGISCCMLDMQIFSLAEFCGTSLPHLPTLERLSIHELMSSGPDNVEGAPWLELLQPFVAVKDLALSRFLAQYVVRALRELTEESVAEVLPELRHVFVDGFDPSGPTQKAVSQFVAARQLSGQPVTVHRVAKGS